MFCTNLEEKPTETVVINTPPAEQHKGFQLLESNCLSCHSTDANAEKGIAPTLADIKNKYLAAGKTKEEFSKNFIAFLNNPSTATSKMPKAVQQFGLMPKMNFTEAQIETIATYLFETSLDNSTWYEEEKKKKPAASVPLSYEEQGLAIAMQTKGVLGKNLLNAITNQGVENALAFCSTQAYPLTDSMSNVLNAKIKRVSDKNRNPQNAANEAELAYIQVGKETLKKGEKIKPLVTETAGKVVAYYPILTDKMCLQCHGKPKEEILPKTWSKIKSLYPKDLAIGYGEKELRGIWVVEF